MRQWLNVERDGGGRLAVCFQHIALVEWPDSQAERRGPARIQTIDGESVWARMSREQWTKATEGFSG